MPASPLRRLRALWARAARRDRTRRILETDGAFDARHYRARYGADIADPVGHYLAEGWRLGHDPAPWFDTLWYIRENPDVAAAGVNPFLHWLTDGRAEGRLPAPDLRRAAPDASVAGAEEADPASWPAPSPREALAKVVILCHAGLASNSGGHVVHFARELVRRGLAVAVAAPGGFVQAFSWLDPDFEYFDLDLFVADPASVLAFDGVLDPGRTVVVAWTPRAVMRRAVAAAVTRVPVPYLVHLEDNEAFLSATGALRRPGEGASEADREARRVEAFLARASGVTVIVDRLREVVPPAVPTLLLRPGVDADAFGRPMPALRRRTLRRALGLGPDARYLVYCGNVHRGNVEEVASLYEAVARVRAAGEDLHLVRTGQDHVPPDLFPPRLSEAAGAIRLGFVDRPVLVELLRGADLAVQPGRPGPFNDYRLPSKLPEFLAAGVPVVLPAANIGLELVDREEALVLPTGSVDEIAAAVLAILRDPELAARLGRGGARHARAHLVWRRQGDLLADFLEAVAGRPDAGRDHG